MKWVVKVVFNDLLDWNDWFIRKRLKPPLMMVALGKGKTPLFRAIFVVKMIFLPRQARDKHRTSLVLVKAAFSAGTFNDQTGKAGNMQDARFESGLDDSPMYDGSFVNTTDGCSQYESGCGAENAKQQPH